MKRAIFIILFCFFFSHPAFALVIEFNQTTQVDGVSITLGDIADFDEDTELSKTLATQTIAQAPGPGQQIELFSRSIIKYLESRISPDTAIIWRGAEKVTVSRSSVHVSSSQILEIIAAFLADNKDKLPEADIRFIPSERPLPFLVPSGELKWEIIPSSPGIVQSSRFSIIFKVDGRVRKNISVRGRLEILAPVVVAVEQLPKGTILTRRNIATSIKDLTSLRTPSQNIDELLGKKIKRTYKAGQVISLSQVEFPPLVRKGELVRIIVNTGKLFITATGIARADGKKNQTIRVQNTNSRKIVYCRVAAPGIVEVAL